MNSTPRWVPRLFRMLLIHMDLKQESQLREEIPADQLRDQDQEVVQAPEADGSLR